MYTSVLCGERGPRAWRAQRRPRAPIWPTCARKRASTKAKRVALPAIAQAWWQRTPALVDDIISTARTMAAAVTHLRAANMPAPVCIGVHALFCDDALQALKASGVGQVVTCNSIEHATNAIDVLPEIAHAAQSLPAATRRGDST